LWRTRYALILIFTSPEFTFASNSSPVLGGCTETRTGFLNFLQAHLQELEWLPALSVCYPSIVGRDVMSSRIALRIIKGRHAPTRGEPDPSA